MSCGQTHLRVFPFSHGPEEGAITATRAPRHKERSDPAAHACELRGSAAGHGSQASIRHSRSCGIASESGRTLILSHRHFLLRPSVADASAGMLPLQGTTASTCS